MPAGATRHRKLLAAERARLAADGDGGGDAGASPVSNEPDETLPFLTDASTGVALSGADAIVAYLYATTWTARRRAPGGAPALWRRRARRSLRRRAAARTRSGLARTSPARSARHRRRVLREALRGGREAAAALGVRGVAVLRAGARDAQRAGDSARPQPCARGSPRRTALQRRAGTFQVPYLEDPNTGVAMFESAEIVAYLRASYQATPPKTREER